MACNFIVRRVVSKTGRKFVIVRVVCKTDRKFIIRKKQPSEKVQKGKINIEYDSFDDMLEDLTRVFHLLFEPTRFFKHLGQREYRAKNREKFVGYEDNRPNKEEKSIQKKKKYERCNDR